MTILALPLTSMVYPMIWLWKPEEESFPLMWISDAGARIVPLMLDSAPPFRTTLFLLSGGTYSSRPAWSPLLGESRTILALPLKRTSPSLIFKTTLWPSISLVISIPSSRQYTPDSRWVTPGGGKISLHEPALMLVPSSLTTASSGQPTLGRKKGGG